MLRTTRLWRFSGTGTAFTDRVEGCVKVERVVLLRVDLLVVLDLPGVDVPSSVTLASLKDFSVSKPKVLALVIVVSVLECLSIRSYRLNSAAEKLPSVWVGCACSFETSFGEGGVHMVCSAGFEDSTWTSSTWVSTDFFDGSMATQMEGEVTALLGGRDYGRKEERRGQYVSKPATLKRLIMDCSVPQGTKCTMNDGCRESPMSWDRRTESEARDRRD